MKSSKTIRVLLAIGFICGSSYGFAQDAAPSAAQIDTTPPAAEGPITADQVEPITGNDLPKPAQPLLTPPQQGPQQPPQQVQQEVPQQSPTQAPPQTIQHGPPGTPVAPVMQNPPSTY